MNAAAPPLLHAFTGYGIELEYMIVQRDSLSVMPIADRLLQADNPDGTRRVVNEVRRGALGWSNELVMHVIEIKNLQPCSSLAPLPDAFLAEVRAVNDRLAGMGARLMPGAMHPWMDPRSETHVWPHDNDAIYRAYDRIFDSRSHGWANLQSMHVNLPFAGDREFARLHAAIRLVLPILPALAASSPITEGYSTGWADYRMHVYGNNANPIPSIAGMVVPETITHRMAYEEHILAPMYRDIARLDPDHVLQEEWLNSRGAIARFERNAIEIRVIDTQECPQADLAIAAATTDVVRHLYEAADDALIAQQEILTTVLAAIFQDCIREADQTPIDHADYLRLLGFPGERCKANELWRFLVARMMEDAQAQQWRAPLQTMLDHGPLARRILRAIGGDFSRSRLQAVYGRLCDCLEDGTMFVEAG
ncbi:MAG TPA: glutamate-cysteine ligase family protein [Noviherbaspirillum sp.]|uniref:carboxylate-amine ligase n=1 Tax=Noviherbaspirillum sp. TaxID=1926288 RepID=UPI002B48FB6A|nr:glutamate-cysteine ligase family protein [Noviherbaspirillum sp.]HJV86012.1 glutamate-cysteine ligase family protein [Noviherbaspirillum sp.]